MDPPKGWMARLDTDRNWAPFCSQRLGNHEPVNPEPLLTLVDPEEVVVEEDGTSWEEGMCSMGFPRKHREFWVFGM